VAFWARHCSEVPSLDCSAQFFELRTVGHDCMDFCEKRAVICAQWASCSDQTVLSRRLHKPRAQADHGPAERGSHLHQVRRAPEPHHANEHEAVCAADKWILATSREPRLQCGYSLHASQSLSRAPNLAGHSRDRSGPRRSRLDDRRNGDRCPHRLATWTNLSSRIRDSGCEPLPSLP